MTEVVDSNDNKYTPIPIGNAETRETSVNKIISTILDGAIVYHESGLVTLTESKFYDKEQEKEPDLERSFKTTGKKLTSNVLLYLVLVAVCFSFCGMFFHFRKKISKKRNFYRKKRNK